MKAAGVACIIAPSFARIFFRNAVNIGLFVLESKEPLTLLNNGDLVEVDPEAGILVDLTTNTNCRISPVPEFIKAITAAGGLTGYVRQRLAGSVY